MPLSTITNNHSFLEFSAYNSESLLQNGAEREGWQMCPEHKGPTLLCSKVHLSISIDCQERSTETRHRVFFSSFLFQLTKGKGNSPSTD